ncbi:MAG: cytochrome c family protein [Thermodesulfobacteriota bacterium]|nr:cytochrome c family protein [Thermodesulfobacteriota bacterium]
MKKAIHAYVVLLAGSLVILFGAVGLPTVDPPADNKEEQAVYVGWEECKACHASVVEAYRGFKRSRNFRILEMRAREHDRQCLPCHTTGYGEPGGFTSIEKTPHLTNVQCEVCHGPASLHIKATTRAEKKETLEIPRNICTQCHTQHGHREL